jgi:hypothetical protein
MQNRGMTVWERREAALAWLKSAGRARFSERNGALAAQVIASSEPLRAYEKLHRVSGAGTPWVVISTDWTVNPAKGQGFEDSRKDLFALFQRSAPDGWALSSLLRFLGEPEQYVVLHATTSLEAARALPRLPEVQQFGQAHSPSTYTTVPPASTFSEIVFTITPAAV